MANARSLLALPALAVPAIAAAGDGSAIVLDFSQGPMRAYLDLTKSVAVDYSALAVIAAIVLEALGRAPGVPRNFGAVVWRIIVIAFLFWNYERLFGAVIAVTDDIASRVRPVDALADYHAYLDSFYAATDGQTGTVTTAAVVAGSGGGSWFGGAIFDAAIGVLLFGAKALVYALDRLARILTASFFIVGPLALIAGIPRQSPTAFSWFRHFVTVASWPIFSGVLLGVMTAVAKRSAGATTVNYLGALIAAAVMALCALAAPVLAGWIVGGAVHNLAGLGLASYQNLTRQVAQMPLVRTVAARVGGAERDRGARPRATHSTRGRSGGPSGAIANLPRP